MKKVFFSVLGIVAAILPGCSSSKHINGKVENVVRVFMHEPHSFSFLVEQPETKELHLQQYYASQPRIHIIADVPANKKMWVDLDCVDNPSSSWSPNCSKLDIHVHSAKEINGAGWNHGKFGRGQITVVE